MITKKTISRLCILVEREIRKLPKYVQPTYLDFEAGDIWVAHWMQGSLWSCY